MRLTTSSSIMHTLSRLLSPTDQHHDDAERVERLSASTRQLPRPRLVAELASYFAECLATFSRRGEFFRKASSAFVEALSRNASVVVVHPDAELFERGLALYRDRPDQRYSLTDCVSMIVCEDLEASRKSSRPTRTSSTRASTDPAQGSDARVRRPHRPRDAHPHPQVRRLVPPPLARPLRRAEGAAVPARVRRGRAHRPRRDPADDPAPGRRARRRCLPLRRPLVQRRRARPATAGPGTT